MSAGEKPPLKFTASKVGELKGFEIVTREGATDVESIEAERPAWRHFCFNAQVLGISSISATGEVATSRAE